MDWQSIKSNRVFNFYLQHRVFINCALLTLLFLWHCFFGWVSWLVFPLLWVMVCADNLENSLTYVLYAIPFCCLNVYLSVVLYLICLVTFFIKFYVILYFVEKNKPCRWSIIAIAAFFIYCLAVTRSFGLNLFMKVSLFLTVFAALGILTKKSALLRVNFNVRVICYAILISGLMGMLRRVSPYLQEALPLFYVNYELPRFQALMFQPNVLAMLCEIMASLLAYLIISRRAKLVDYILLFGLTCLGFTTFSKTFLVLISVIYFSIFIWLLFRNFAKMLDVIILLIFFLISLRMVFPDLVISYLGRFGGTFTNCETLTDCLNFLTTGRFNLWMTYLGYLFQHPVWLIFGKGLGAFILPTVEFSSHNFFISMLYEFGILGSAFFVTAIVLMIRELKHNSTTKINRAIIVPIIVLLLLLCVEDFILYIF